MCDNTYLWLMLIGILRCFVFVFGAHYFDIELCMKVGRLALSKDKDKYKKCAPVWDEKVQIYKTAIWDHNRWKKCLCSVLKTTTHKCVHCVRVHETNNANLLVGKIEFELWAFRKQQTCTTNDHIQRYTLTNLDFCSHLSEQDTGFTLTGKTSV